MSVSLEDVLAQLNPKLRKNILVGDEVPKTEYAATPSFGLNRAMVACPTVDKFSFGEVSQAQNHLYAFKQLL
jgi:hypothetical protein